MQIFLHWDLSRTFSHRSSGENVRQQYFQQSVHHRTGLTDRRVVPSIIHRPRQRHRPVYFARLHKMFTTFHSFVYQRRGDQTCSYLVAYRQGSGLHYGYVMVYVLIDTRCLVSESLHYPFTSSMADTSSIAFRLWFNLWLLMKENAYQTHYRLILYFQLLTHRCDLSTLSVKTQLHLSRTHPSSLYVPFMICMFDAFLFVSIIIYVLHIFRVLTSITE